MFDVVVMVGVILSCFVDLVDVDGLFDFVGVFILVCGEGDWVFFEMIKWFDFNYYYLVLEIGLDIVFYLVSDWFVCEVVEMKVVGFVICLVIVGLVIFLLLSKVVDGVFEGFILIFWLVDLFLVYFELFEKLVVVGVEWV